MGNSQSTSLQQEQKSNTCPVIHSNPSSTQETINPSNNIPELLQAPAPGQKTVLSLDRTLSSIPKATPPGLSGEENRSACPVQHGTGTGGEHDDKQTWVYPSPQQFYNALVRKGWETPEEAIPVMVDIHNWMNEAVWGEVLRWETRYFPTPNACPSASHKSDQLLPNISLVKFQGRPQDLSPKARFHLLLSKVFPQLYNPVRPFDRHDWSICRHDAHPHDLALNSHKISRYVIDYYNGGHDLHGNPVFHFDVRPAIDDLDSLVVRLKEWARLKNERWFGIPNDQSNSTP